MSVIGKAVEIAARYLPDAPPDPLRQSMDTSVSRLTASTACRK